ncbi:hypothetical protein SASPL_152433 [Salvia splendens]|uniref:Amino acid transporter transmembrane domain-containing protein n=1 Tax=Salvia splendens TaxID=180675 RepID=A0A8X8W392_SALSN|nr:hypothetical protein SASPL_152433 [Salvia splendens]
MVEFDDKDKLSDALLRDVESSSSDSHASVKRTGTVWTAIAHIITGVIGSGVLSLAWSVAQLGWIAGPLSMVLFAIVTIISSNILCDCYRYPYPEDGHIRNKSYAEAVGSYLGILSSHVSLLLLHISTRAMPIAIDVDR